jgi:hypothetical protein
MMKTSEEGEGENDMDKSEANNIIAAAAAIIVQAVRITNKL